jgi:hypothetical protein
MANYQEIYVDQGSTFTAELTVQKDGVNFSDLDEYTFEGHIRKQVNTTGSPVASFSFTQDSQTPHVVTISLTATQTALLSEKRYVYDVEATLGDNIYRLIEGHITVSPNVTRD